MPTSYTSLLGLALPVTGELSGTWGDVVNNYITDYIDASVAGTQTISGSQTAVTLSVTNGASLSQVGSGSTGSAQYQIINCTGNPAGLLTITAPASSREYIILNSTSTSQSVKIVGAGPTTGVTLVSGEKALVAWNGSDFVKAASTVVPASSLTGTVAVANGGTGLSSGTSGGVLAFTASGTIASSGVLAANSLVIGGGAGVAPSTTTTGTGVLTAVGNAVNTSGGLVTQSGTLTSSALLLGGGSGTAISSTTTGTGVVTALGINVGSSGAFTTNNAANTFTAAQTFRAASAIRSEAASTQDAVVIAGRAGGTSSYASTITPATLSANQTVTIPNETFTIGFRNIPAVGTKTGSYTLAVGDVGKYVQVGSGGSITIPDATFAEGDAISIFNNTTGNITITCTITTAYIAGTDSDKASVTLATRGVATILFISSTVCVISGNVS